MNDAAPQTAAALVIGNELLSGKIRDENIAYLAKTLFDRGIALKRVIVCEDELEVIARDLAALRADHDVVFTSGGIGPTHDDVTLEAVARAFGRRTVRHPQLEGLLRRHVGERLTEAHLRMAEVPEGAELVADGQARWPTVSIDNVFVLPGVPTIFRRKLDALGERLSGGPPFVCRMVRTESDEGAVAPLLSELDARYPSVNIGSYPRWRRDGRYHLVITFDSRDAEQVDAALRAFEDATPDARRLEAGGLDDGSADD